MPIPTYTLGYPPDGASLGQTKSTIRNNLDGTFQTVAVDHIDNNGNPGSRPAGYHNVIHSVPQGSDPVAVTGYGQLYSKTVSAFSVNDQALFWESGGGLIQQLTTNLTPVVATSGATFLAGGVVIQWGSGSGGDNTSVSFARTFPTNLFSLVVSNNGGATQSVVSASNLTTSGFKIKVNPNNSISFSYIAIGN